MIKLMKKIVVDEGICIGCGACVAMAPKSFRLNEKGKSEPIGLPAGKAVPPGDSEEKLEEAIEGCPVRAIRRSD